MSASDDEISWQLVLVLLIPVVVVLSMMGYVIYDSIAFGAGRVDAPDATVVFEDHPDDLNRTTSGDGILNGTLRGDDSIEWRHLSVEVVNSRSGAVVASLSSPLWLAEGAGQVIVVRVDGEPPPTNGTFEPDETFVLRELDGDTDGSSDLIEVCEAYRFRVRYEPSDAIIGSRTFAIVSEGVPGQPCETAG